MWHKTLRIENVHSRTNGLGHITMTIFYIQCVKMCNGFHCCCSRSSSNSVTLKSGFSFLVGFFVYFNLVYFFCR